MTQQNDHRFTRAEQTPAPRSQMAYEQRSAGYRGPDILEELGIIWSYPQIGDERGRMFREIATEKALETQKVPWQVAPGAHLILADGRRLGAGDELTLDDVDGSRAALARLIALNVISVVPPRIAWQRSLPANVGPYCWAGKKPRTLADGRVVQPGETVTEEDFAPAKVEEPDPVEATVRRITGIYSNAPPPMSEFRYLLLADKIVKNPNYVAANTKKAGSK